MYTHCATLSPPVHKRAYADVRPRIALRRDCKKVISFWRDQYFCNLLLEDVFPKGRLAHYILPTAGNAGIASTPLSMDLGTWHNRPFCNESRLCLRETAADASGAVDDTFATFIDDEVVSLQFDESLQIISFDPASFTVESAAGAPTLDDSVDSGYHRSF